MNELKKYIDNPDYVFHGIAEANFVGSSSETIYELKYGKLICCRHHSPFLFIRG